MKIGKVIKEYRKEKGLSLRKMAELTGVSPATLSQIENNKTSPNLITLKKIAQVLDVTVISLVATEEKSNISFVKSKDRRKLIRNTTPQGDIVEEFLVENLRHEMEVALITLPPFAEESEPVSHEGEEYIFVLEGVIEVQLHGVGIYVMEEGDTLYYPCSIPHSFRNISDKVTRILITATPPNF